MLVKFPRFWLTGFQSHWWQKLLLTGFLALLEPGEPLQLFVGVLVAFLAVALQAHVRPYQNISSNHLAMLSDVAIFLTLLGTLGLEVGLEPGSILILLTGAALVVVVAAVLMLLSELSAASAAPTARWASDGALVVPQPLAAAEFHLFISHQWGSAQDQARSLKSLLLLVCRGLRIFLDVDDLGYIEELEAYVDKADAIIVFLTGSLDADGQRSDYFRSRNCVREFRQAVKRSKKVVLVLETDPQHGGVAWETHRAACPEDLRDALDEMRHVPWYRVRDFNLVTLSLLLRAAVLERPEDSIALCTTQRPHPRPCQLHASPFNEGAFDVASRLARAADCLTVSPDGGDVFVLLLDRNTYTSPKSGELRDELETVLRMGRQVLLDHEQSG